MEPMTFHPVVADLGAQVVQLGGDALQAGDRASLSVTGLPPAGADEVSALASAAFQNEAASLLQLHAAAQQELMRAGTAFIEIAQTYTDVDESAARAVVFSALPMSARWSAA